MKKAILTVLALYASVGIGYAAAVAAYRLTGHAVIPEGYACFYKHVASGRNIYLVFPTLPCPQTPPI